MFSRIRQLLRRAVNRVRSVGPSTPPGAPIVDIWVAAEGDGAVDPSQAAAWLGQQTLSAIRILGVGRSGERVFSESGGNRYDDALPAPWFMVPGSLPAVPGSWLESTVLVLASHRVDAVIHAEGVAWVAVAPPTSFDDCLDERWRERLVLRTDRWPLRVGRSLEQPSDGSVVLFLGQRGISGPPETGTVPIHSLGSYFVNGSDLARPFGYCDGVRELARPRLSGGPDPSCERPSVLVLTSFLATGGAERTLEETLRFLAAEIDFSIATLAPHRDELGDRREEFRGITPRVYSLGDLMHPDAMIPVLEYLLEATGASVLYNANGTTLFYEFAAELKRRRPGLRIVDHLYDHRVGYIESYGPHLLTAVDLCVAENHRIEQTLIEDYGWRPEQVEVIWPCGRSEASLPAPSRHESVRASSREVLGAAPGDVVFLTAARMHAQKRPLDLVTLAGRVADTSARFVIVGGGPLEEEVDRAVEESGLSNIVRLSFRDDVPELLLGADVGCLVSEYEGLPVFMLESFQSGTPFLGTAVGEMGAVLASSGAGLVVQAPGDIAALEAAVRQLCESPTREHLAARAREIAPQFSVEECARRYATAFFEDRVPGAGRKAPSGHAPMSAASPLLRRDEAVR